MLQFRGHARATILLALTAAYLAAGKLGLSRALVHASASAGWPPTGIALAHFHRIFQMFFAVDPDGDSTRVGLAIVRKIVEMHGGSVSVASTPGRGATFRFSIPKPTR